MIALLDVNVIIALLDEAHVQYDTASNWFWTNEDQGWASCPITQNGCVRIISHRNYVNHKPIDLAAQNLDIWTQLPSHHFWPDDLSISGSDLFDLSVLTSPKYLTDIYLLGLAAWSRLTGTSPPPPSWEPRRGI